MNLTIIVTVLEAIKGPIIFHFPEPLAKPPTSVGGSLSSAYALWVTIVRCGSLLSRGATRAASGAAEEELKISGEEAR